jgi:glutamate transport system substrate-binding protein
LNEPAESNQEGRIMDIGMRMKPAHFATGLVGAAARRSTSALLAGLLVLGGAAWADTAPTFPEGSTMAKIVASGKFRVGVKFDKPGFSEKTLDGSYEGMDIEITKMITKALGMSEDQIEWTETVSNNREPFLQQGKVDLVAASYAIRADRQKVVTFAGPYSNTENALIVTKGNPLKINTWDDVNGKKVCGISASQPNADVEAHAAKAVMIGFDTQAKCVTALKNGQVDIVAGSFASLGGFVAREPKAFEFSPVVWGGEVIGVGMPKGEIDFCEFIDDVLKKAWASGEFQTAWNKTLAKNLNEEPQELQLIPCE